MISTQHFKVDELHPSDAKALSKLMAGNRLRFERDFPKILEQNLTQEASIAYIRRKQKEIQSRTEFTWAIRDSETGVVAGLIILKELNWSKSLGEFAYCIGAAWEGRGWMTITVNELTKYAFSELGLQRLQIIAHQTNLASIKIAENCGYHWVRVLPKSHTPPNGIPLDMELYENHSLKV